MPWSLLHIITKLELGGAQRATLYEIEHSRFADGQRYLAYGPGGLLDAEAQAMSHVECFAIPTLGRDIHLFSDLWATIAIAKLVRRLRRSHPHTRLLVHTHSSKAGVVGRLGAYLGGADCIVHSIHGFGHSHHGHRLGRRVLLATERLAASVSDGFTADSRANIVEAERDRLICNTMARVVRCGVDLDVYTTDPGTRTQLRASLGIAFDVPVVLTLACLKPQKDPLTWARVAERVVASRPDTIFLLAGDGELRGELTAFIAQRQLTQNVRLLGWRRDVADLLHASDIFLLTSRWEGLPQVIIQAMAARLAVIATDVDGNREAVGEGETGLLFAPGDVSGMAHAVIDLVGAPQRRKEMGALGSTRCQPFSCTQMISDLDGLYAALTEQPDERKPRTPS